MAPTPRRSYDCRAAVLPARTACVPDGRGRGSGPALTSTRSSSTCGTLLALAAGDGRRRWQPRPLVPARSRSLATEPGATGRDIELTRRRPPPVVEPRWPSRRLLAVPVPTVEGLLLVARNDDPAFTEDDVLVAGPARPGGRAVAAPRPGHSRLARAMWEFSDVPALEPETATDPARRASASATRGQTPEMRWCASDLPGCGSVTCHAGVPARPASSPSGR